ncbi:transcription initiation factor TFIID 23-30kDa subunit-domain-containing protein, partial [Entophlyctis helioformis]
MNIEEAGVVPNSQPQQQQPGPAAAGAPGGGSRPNATAAQTQAQHDSEAGAGAGQAPASKRRKTKHELDMERKEEALSEVLLLMQDYSPVIPDAITDYHLARAGFESPDIRLKRLLSLATQKFVSDIATDALQYAKLRQQAGQAKDRKTSLKDRRMVLTMTISRRPWASMASTSRSPTTTH